MDRMPYASEVSNRQNYIRMTMVPSLVTESEDYACSYFDEVHVTGAIALFSGIFSKIVRRLERTWRQTLALRPSIFLMGRFPFTETTFPVSHVAS